MCVGLEQNHVCVCARKSLKNSSAETTTLLYTELSVQSGASRFTSETFHNDLVASIDFIAMVN